MSSESEWEPPSTAEDSDSEWEPAPKKRRLNTTKSSSRRKATKRRRIQKSATSTSSIPTKRKSPRGKRARNALKHSTTVPQCPPLPEFTTTYPVDSEDDIEILDNRRYRTPKTTTSKRKRSKTLSKTRKCREYKRSESKAKKSKVTSKTSKSSKSRKSTKSKTKKKSSKSIKFKPGPQHIVNIENLDTLICALYRSLILKKSEKHIASTMPRDVTNLVDKYQKHILYFEVNFVWTHKYACCHAYAQCTRLKRNRGHYIFERDPNNQFDRNAIKIMTHSGERVGHIPKEQAYHVAPLMDQGKIDLKSVGGQKKYTCREMVEVVELKSLTDREKRSLQTYLPLERASFDENRYVSVVPRTLTV